MFDRSTSFQFFNNLQVNCFLGKVMLSGQLVPHFCRMSCLEGRHFLIYHRFAIRTKHCLYSSCRIMSYSSTSRKKDHYGTLGISREATAKEVKSAFYQLSKKHHPDVNPENKAKAAKKFQELSEAYEVLGSDEKRRVYDSLTAKRPAPTYNYNNSKFHRSAADSTRKSSKDWGDMDIDYRDFEFFQRSNRRKRVFHSSAGDTTDSFWAAQQGYAENYKNEKVLEREFQERRLRAQLAEIERRATHPVPTFEQLRIQEEERKRKRKAEYYRTAIPMFLCGLAVMMVIMISSR